LLRIILVRHGQTGWSGDSPGGEHIRDRERFRGQVDVPLNRTGIAQADAVADALSRVAIAAVYASPLSRAMDTARPLAARRALPVEPLDALLDIDYGCWAGRSHREVAQAWPEQYRQWRAAPHSLRVPGGEGLEDVQERFSRGLARLLKRHEREIVLLVGHQVVNKVAICHLLGLDLSAFWRIRQDLACINRFDLDAGLATLLTVNELGHLPTRPREIDELLA
jgi:broad specificity phosphatase PhoE